MLYRRKELSTFAKSSTLSKYIRIGTRGSKLALWQAHKVEAELLSLGFNCGLEIIKTQGDRVQDLGFDKLEGKGFFTKEIEEALLEAKIDVAVHSLKDLPTLQPNGLCLAGLSERADARDILLIRTEITDENGIYGLPKGANIGTSSLRRQTQILDLVPDTVVTGLRGNVPTRVNKLREGHYDAIILAAAGIERLELDLSDLISKKLHPREFVPAPAQGIIGYQVREDDHEMRRIIKLIHHPQTASRSNVERQVLRMMDGGCQMPLGVYCEKDGVGNYHVHAAFAADANTPLTRANISQSTQAGLAERMVEKLREEK